MNQVNQKAFVGMRLVASDADLRKLLEETISGSPRYYFLRWVHRVSGFINTLPLDFPSPEGELHMADFEVRWQQTPKGYDVLLLHSGEPNPAWKFQPIGADWITPSNPLTTHLHPKGSPQETSERRKDTRFPNEFHYPDRLTLHHRYFQNSNTGTVHFVALTLALQENKS